MSTAIITPQRLSGSIDAPPAKSIMHRAIICALLARSISEIYPVDLSNDIMATINAAKTLGAFANVVSNRLIIDSRNAFNSNYININCNESGSTLRFLLPVVSAFGINAIFEGVNSLISRPMGVYAQILPDFGVRCSYSGKLPFAVSGKLKAGRFLVPADVSSQFITGLLLALPLLKEDSEIIFTTALASSGYIDTTIKVMQDFGVKVIRTNVGFKIPKNQHYCAQKEYFIEGDWSQSAFFMAAGAISGHVTVRGLSLDSFQGDKIVAKILYRMGAKISYNKKKCEITVASGRLSNFNIFAAQNPDLVPVLAVLGACAEGTMRILGVSRLRYKESDRLYAINDGLTKLGVNVTEVEDGLLIKGQKQFDNSNLNGFNDHRIVMAFSVAAIRARERISISDAESISKSYPSFFEDYNKLGGSVNVLDI